MASGSWRQDEYDFLAASKRDLNRRYREEMAVFIAGLAEWTLFANPLTFDPLMMAGTSPAALEKGRQQLAVPSVSRWTAMRRFRYFLEKSSRALGRPTVGVIALEPHTSGQPHGHGLMGIEGGLVGQEIRTLAALWRDYPGNGYIRLEEPRSQEDVTRYSAKYMAKDVSEMVMSASLGRDLTPLLALAPRLASTPGA